MIQIMIVDDEALIREGLKQIISRNADQFNVCHEASNGEDALDKIERFQPHIILTDVKMPKMGGIELLEQTTRRYPGIKNIIISGYNDYSLVRNSFRNGVCDYLLKPIDSDELIALLLRLREEINAEALQRMKRIEEEMRLHQSKDREREQAFNELIRQTKDAAALEQTLMERYPLSGSFEYFAVFVIRIDHFQKNTHTQTTKNDLPLLQYAIKNITGELIGAERPVIVFSAAPDEIVAIAEYCVKEDMADIAGLSVAMAERIRDAVERHLWHTVTIGISRIGHRLRSARVSYQEARLATRFRIFQSNNRVIHIDATDGQESALFSYTPNKEKKLLTQIELRNQAKALHLADEIFSELSPDTPAVSEHMEQVCDDILRRILLLIRENDIKYSMHFEQRVIPESKSFDDPEHLKQWLKTVITDVIYTLNSQSYSNSRHLVQEAKRFVMNNYFTNLTLNTIAEYFYISPQYFCEVFKKESGENFIEYVTSVRIEKAKALLKKPDIKTYEVGEIVGYDSPTYFSKVFKKIVGVSPQKYRSSHLK